MRIQAFALLSALLFAPDLAVGQMPAPAVPDNTLNSTNTIGLPPASSKEGNAEVVNLNNGGLNLFLPIVAFPQRAGAALLQLGFTYDSNQVNLQEVKNVSVENDTSDDAGIWENGGAELVDFINIGEQTGQIAGVFSAPLDLNIPQLTGSLEYFGDWTYNDAQGSFEGAGPLYCVTNLAFRDWQGSTHAFELAFGAVACDEESATINKSVAEVYTDNSNDQEYYHLDATNRADFVVYAPDGTAYHFANPHLPCGTQWGLNCPQGGSVEQYINMPMSSSVDRFGNTMNYTKNSSAGNMTSSGTLTDTVGRTIQIGKDPTTGNFTISYKDTNGNQQSVSLVGLPSADLTIPQASGQDVGPYLQTNTCSLTAVGSGYPITPIYAFNTSSDPTPPLRNSSSEFMGIGVHYSSTGQTYKLLFDSFGHLMRITYPEGGYHRYDYAGYLVNIVQNDATCNWTTTQVAHRYECAKSSGACSTAEEATTTYSPNDSSANVATDPCLGTVATPGVLQNGMVLNKETMVQDPDGTTTFHCFDSGGINASPGDAFVNHETDVYTYSASGSLLRYVNEYPSVYFPSKVTTTVYDGSSPQASYTTYQYDTVPITFDTLGDPWHGRCGYYLGNGTSSLDPYIGCRAVSNPTQMDVYGYNGTHLKSITESWYYYGGNAHAPLSTTVTDPQSGAWHTTRLDYKGTACVNSYTESGSNANTSTWTYTPDAWCRPTAIKDPNEYTTTYGYSDLSNGWSDATCAPAADSYAYLTSITNPLQQTAKFKYYSCTGQLGTSSDPNGTNVSLTYDGAQRVIQRLVQSGTTLADQITATYVDGPGGSITHTVKASPDPVVVSVYSRDGLGRVFDVSVASDPYGATHTTTYFNAEGEVQAVTNPYRTEVGGITSYLYDGLQRKT
jgi:YD repeat-containing protein